MCSGLLFLHPVAQNMACAFQVPSVVVTLGQEGPLVELVIGCMRQCINTLDSYLAKQGVDLGAFWGPGSVENKGGLGWAVDGCLCSIDWRFVVTFTISQVLRANLIEAKEDKPAGMGLS